MDEDLQFRSKYLKSLSEDIGKVNEYVDLSPISHAILMISGLVMLFFANFWFIGIIFLPLGFFLASKQVSLSTPLMRINSYFYHENRIISNQLYEERKKAENQRRAK